MFLNKRNTQILIVLTVMILTLATGILNGRRQAAFIAVCQAMQVTATVGILFGILKAHPSHKPFFYKLWLGITSVFFTCLVFLLLDYVVGYYQWRYFWGDSTVLLLAAAGVVYMMSIVYKEFVELTQGTLDSVEVEQPPTYVPALDISLKS
ncbi:hypothetical protein ACLKA7_013133 [Drosophila subpalustris]